MTFLGLNGIFAFSEPAAALVLVALVALGTGGFLTGRPRSPVAVEALSSLPPVAGSTFSFSGSWKVTCFLVAGFVAVTVAARARVVVAVLLGGSTDSVLDGRGAFLGLPRVALTGSALGSGLGASAAACRAAALARVALPGADDADGSADCSLSTFFGRPRGRGACVVVSDSSSCSLSSARVFLLVDIVGRVEAGAALALAAAVIILVVLGAVASVFAAARARVILLGGD